MGHQPLRQWQLVRSRMPCAESLLLSSREKHKMEEMLYTDPLNLGESQKLEVVPNFAFQHNFTEEFIFLDLPNVFIIFYRWANANRSFSRWE